MPSRREFIQAVAALAGTAGIPEAIRKAMAIEPEPGSSVLDAEHVVILMQENRSFRPPVRVAPWRAGVQ